MIQISPEQFENILPLAVEWAEAKEKVILKSAAEVTQLISPATIGLSLRYGIFIHSNFSKDRYTIVHELVHTMQCEKLGGISPFLRKYLWECIEVGYPQAPLEQEAVRIASVVCRV